MCGRVNASACVRESARMCVCVGASCVRNSCSGRGGEDGGKHLHAHRHPQLEAHSSQTPTP